MNTKLWIYDTTLRDGSQAEGISLSANDKLKIARQLDAMGVPFIEGGWPGANPKDVEFFLKLQEEPLTLSLIHISEPTNLSTSRMPSSA